jgi:quercetin dioxygenase-like cupin family protein
VSSAAFHIAWDRVAPTIVAPGIERQVVHGDGLTVLRLRLAAGALLPRHDHPHEQCTTVLAGRMTVVVQDSSEPFELAAGDTLIIPGGVAHEARAATDVLVLELFVPRRDDLPAS